LCKAHYLLAAVFYLRFIKTYNLFLNGFDPDICSITRLVWMSFIKTFCSVHNKFLRKSIYCIKFDCNIIFQIQVHAGAFSQVASYCSSSESFKIQIVSFVPILKFYPSLVVFNFNIGSPKIYIPVVLKNFQQNCFLTCLSQI
jgi:hypothetical protein